MYVEKRIRESSKSGFTVKGLPLPCEGAEFGGITMGIRIQSGAIARNATPGYTKSASRA
jgi:hypothetical protein